MSSLPEARDGDDDANTKEEKVEESHEDCFTVPDVSAATADNGGAVNDGNSNNNVNNRDQVQHQLGGVSSEWKRRRGRNPVDKENRRIKRLLRNRVSAQEARERKKVYVNELETRAKELQDESAKLEEMISTLINENAMLRKVLMNMRCTSSDGSNEPKDDQSSKC